MCEFDRVLGEKINNVTFRIKMHFMKLLLLCILLIREIECTGLDSTSLFLNDMVVPPLIFFKKNTAASSMCFLHTHDYGKC